MKKISNIFSTLLLILLAAAVMLLVVPRVFGIKMYAVQTGSMRPELQVGDMVYAVPTAFEDISEGDVITYVLNEQLTLVTHRVEEIDEENQMLYTKGDANNVRDGSPVYYPNVVGVVRFSLPKAGYLISALTQTKYQILAVTGILVLIILSMIGNVLKKEEVLVDTVEEREGGND